MPAYTRPHSRGCCGRLQVAESGEARLDAPGVVHGADLGVGAARVCNAQLSGEPGLAPLLLPLAGVQEEAGQKLEADPRHLAEVHPLDYAPDDLRRLEA